jgi:taurine dehydrogenase small subunit
MDIGSVRARYVVSWGARSQMYGELTRRRAGVDSERMMTTNDLQAFFGNGWNRHDVDVLMTFMADDCIFESTAGPEVCGARHAGRERVRAAFARVFEVFPDARFGDARHFVAGNRGVSEWLFTGTTAEGKKVEVNGCDLFTFEGDKIALKSSYFKTRT